MRRGFVLSFSTLLLLIVLVWFAMYYAEMTARADEKLIAGFAAQKAGFVADDLDADLNALLGTQIRVMRDGPRANIVLDSTVPPPLAGDLDTWESFVENRYAQQQIADVNVDAGRIADGRAELLFDNGAGLDIGYGQTRYVQFYRRDATDTGVTTYDINVEIAGATYQDFPANHWICHLNRDVNVNLRITDKTGEAFFESCKQGPDTTYTHTMAFSDATGEVVVTYGSVDGNANAVRIQNNVTTPGVQVRAHIRAETYESNVLFWHYPADLNYVQGNTQINRVLGAGRG